MSVALFTPMINLFDANVLGTINTGSANIISLISPLVMTGFFIYLGLIGLSYFNGRTEVPVGETVKRLVAWATIIGFGLNISQYSTYVVPFFNGLGDDLASALTSTPDVGTALDNLLNAYLGAIKGMYSGIGMLDVLPALEAVMLTGVLAFFGLVFMGIAAAYIILAHFALGILLALGPMFISAALFPATRRFFDAWAGQCISYALLTALFASVAAIEVNFATSLLPANGSFGAAGSNYAGYLEAVFSLALMGIVFIVVSLNMPSLASQLAGGVGISSMVGKVGAAAGAAAAGVGAVAKTMDRQSAPAAGGEIRPESL